jgi:hypothetical protein
MTNTVGPSGRGTGTKAANHAFSGGYARSAALEPVPFPDLIGVRPSTFGETLAHASELAGGRKHVLARSSLSNSCTRETSSRGANQLVRIKLAGKISKAFVSAQVAADDDGLSASRVYFSSVFSLRPL